ncbi:undecaprenyl-phosphate glucose phosphotransferase [Rhizobiaceae bacterium n13]|uniref:Undecaprenyl-phosphate glucose phosphotransferase n=1 Tax=Ferirhizobium litorale TaxID=2927786 RepID=A0AAE3QDD2_9HYPH|nr:undecaprenyl-phosphate glucose phosphotransferase [Fererhizobium litorale]MDI7861007.1 undecaprenyl-phosphate glucose phosphotransferase [Fererhizobium litorale]MDI7921154.1 undecaprenyl-phosphate glucose phosphotransferase [Fererhizobium litorale]
MYKFEKPEQIDVQSLRKKISGASARGDQAEPAEGQGINPLAQQIAQQFSESSFTPAMIVGLLRLAEFAGVFITGLLVHITYNTGSHFPFLGYISIIAVGSAFTVLLLQITDAYQIPALRTPSKILPRILGAWAITFALMAVAIFFLKSGHEYSRVWFLSWFMGGAGYLVLERSLVAFAIRRWARNGVMERRAVIVGGGAPAKALIRAFEQQPDNDIRICGIFDDRGEARSPAIVAGYPKLGTIGELVEFARLARIDMLIIALPLTAESRILQLLKKLWVLPVDIRLAAHSNSLRFRPRSYSHIGAVPMLDIFDKPIRDWDSVAKRIFDIAFSLVALALLWPAMIGAAIAIKTTSKGPVFFMQKRHGFNNEIINVLKFRSMYTEMSDPTARLAVTKGDPRVTPVGRFLRKSSIDELPQLFNVLRGQLSLVGPRPHAVLAQTHDRAYADIVEGYFARHRVKPGVTGWAQINGWRGEIDHDDKIKFRTAYDLYYIENWSLFFDLKILFLTPFRLLNTENAY